MSKVVPVAVAAAAALLFSDVAYAQDAANNVSLGKGIAVGLGALGGALGQGIAARGLYESISRNPAAVGQLQVPFFVGFAFMESIALLAIIVNGI
jgi:F-type H+-transporting ATPase subunit c